jgi:hypothetical protein
MKWDRKKAIHQELVGEVQRIQAKRDVPAKLYLDTSKDIQKLTIDTKERPKRDWEALPYHEESKEKESCDDTRIKTTKINEQQFSINEILNFLKGKLEGMLDEQILNMKMEVKLGQLLKICPQL